MLFFSSLALLCLVLCVAAQDYYKLLDVDKNASDRDLKKAYRRLSKKYHPDKNPDDEAAAQKFVEISEAYEVLSDDNLRRIYNQHGAEGVKQHRQRESGPGGGRNPFDMFAQFFGGAQHSGQRRGPNMELRVQFPLKDFYTGADHVFRIDKQVICDKCDGSGSEDGQRDTCDKCKGQGMVIQKQMLAPGIYQQMQMQCDKCGGRGSTVKHKCKKCSGERVVRQEESFDVTVEKGMPRGARVHYEGDADESPDYQAGDIVVQVTQQEPALEAEEKERTDGSFFRRKDQNLFWREVLSLREAWMGDWTRNLTHLDGHVVHLSRGRGVVIQPGTVEVVEGEGMPVWKWDGEGPEFGSLHVEYVVVIPDQMEKGMEKDFHAVFDKWRKKNGIDLHKDSGRPRPVVHEEL